MTDRQLGCQPDVTMHDGQRAISSTARPKSSPLAGRLIAAHICRPDIVSDIAGCRCWRRTARSGRTTLWRRCMLQFLRRGGWFASARRVAWSSWRQAGPGSLGWGEAQATARMRAGPWSV